MIDAHHHFWRYNIEEYGWIGADMSALRRDFMPADLKTEIEAAGISGVVSVQARQSLEETRDLMRFASENDWILGVVGWVPLASPHLEGVLEELTSHRTLKAVRHVVQDEPAGFLHDSAINRGIGLLKKFDLAYDVLILENQLLEAIEFVDRHPDQIFVLDHIAKPRIKDGAFEPWAQQINELSLRDNVSCKVSGMVTEAHWNNWTSESLKPYFDTVLNAFGPSRLMFGSDWPVCLVATGYAQWAQVVRNWVAPLSAHEQNEILGDVCSRIYRLEG
jgi:L-fuconolactonase